MDSYSLKQDNRRKFHDKEKLKRKHATPSDRKHRILNKKLSQEESPLPCEEEHQKSDEDSLLSNEHRYSNDLLNAEENNAEISGINSKLKQILAQRSQRTTLTETQKTGNYKRADLENMNIASLNTILSQHKVVSRAPPEETAVNQKPCLSTPEKKQTAKETNYHRGSSVSSKSIPSNIPTTLQEDESFLDGMI